MSVTAALSGAAGSLAGDSAKKGDDKKGAGPVAYLKAHKGVAFAGAAAVAVGAALYAKSHSSSSTASGTTTPATTATSTTPATYTGSGGGGWEGGNGSGGENGGGSALLSELQTIETTLQGIQATDTSTAVPTPPTLTGTSTPPPLLTSGTGPPQQVTTITAPPSAAPGSIGASGPSAAFPAGTGPVAQGVVGNPNLNESTLQALHEGEQNTGSSSGVAVPSPVYAPPTTSIGNSTGSGGSGSPASSPGPVVAKGVVGNANLNESELQGIH